MGLFVLCTFIRIYPLVEEIKERKVFQKMEFRERETVYFSGFLIRGLILKHFCVLFIDLFCLTFVFVCLISWRSVIFYREYNEADTEWDKRLVIFTEFLQVMLDIPLIICFLISFCTWRLPFVCIDLHHYRRTNKRWNKTRYLGLKHLALVFLDIPCIIAFFITLLSWRSPMLIWSLIGHNVFKRDSHWKSHMEVRRVSLLQFLYLFVDIPSIVCALFVLVTVWRMPKLIKETKKHLSKEYNSRNFYKREFKIRGSCFKQFGMVWVDVFSCVLALIVFVTLWRAGPLHKDMKKYYNKYKGRTEEREKSSSPGTEQNGSDEVEQFDRSGVEHVEDNNGRENNDVTNDVRVLKVDEVPLKSMKWSQCMWKIRRQIFFHFAMLFIDIPAIPLCLSLLLTGVRASKLISALISGQFYMLFAITVYVETLKLFRDIFFVFMFVVLMILRPIESWVHLLEDEEHREYRILLELILWVPDICAEREAVYELMEDKLTLYIKQQRKEADIKVELRKIIEKQHLKRVREILQKLNGYELEGEFTCLLKKVEFVENKRVGKMLRKYYIENSYINRCDPKLHNDNLRKYKDEMRQFDQDVVTAYDRLLNYKPDQVPLYATKCGLKLRSGKETRQVLLDCLPRGRFLVTIIMFLCCLLIYRTPKMINDLRKKSYDRYNIVLGTLKEYGKDVATLARIIFVLIFLYRAPIMLADILDCLIDKRSWKAVRKIVKKHPPQMLNDLGHVMLKLMSWETPRFILTMLLFGILMPAELFLSVVRIGVKDKCISYLFTIMLYVIFVIGPFVFTLYGVEKVSRLEMDWVISAVICVFVLLLLLQLLIMIVSLTKKTEKTFLMTMPKCDYVRLNWFNIHALLFEVLEFLQTIALVFKFSYVPMYGGEILRTLSTYLLFSFFSYETIFWITVVTFVIWFFLCGAPHIFENILQDVVVGTIAKRTSWRLTLSLLANTLFVTIVENLSSSLACNYNTCSKYVNVTNVSMVATGNSTNTTISCIMPYLVEDPSVQCWTGHHLGHATFAMFAIVWYTTTSLIFGTQYGDPENKELDIGFSPIYNMIINVFKAGIIVIATVVTGSNYVVLGFLLVGYTLCLFYTVCFRWLFQGDPCNLQSVLVWRLCSFISCIFASIGVLVAFVLNNPNSIVPLLIFLLGTFLTFCISVIVAVKYSETSAVERDREDFKKEIIILEERLVKNEWMHKGWKREEKTWGRLIASVREAWKDDRDITNPTRTDSLSNAPIVLNRQPSLESNIDDALVTFGVNPTQNMPIENPSPQSKDGNDSASVDLILVPPPPFPTVEYSPIPPPPPFPTVEYSPIPPPPPFPTVEYSPIPPPPPFLAVEYSSTDDVPPPNYQSMSLTVQNENMDITPTYFLPDSAIELEKNGRNLLLILEKYVLYSAYRYASLSQRNIWISMVCRTNWTGLLHELRILNKNLQGSYNKPSALDISLARVLDEGYRLDGDEQDGVTPPATFIKKSKEEIASESTELRNNVLNFFGENHQYGENYREIFDKLLPTGPVFKSFCSTPGIVHRTFDINFRRQNSFVITEFEPPGLKIAVGASITVGKKLCGQINEEGIQFSSKPVGKKGPVSVSVDTLTFCMKNDCLYIMVNGKKVKYEVALSSCKTVKWS